MNANKPECVKVIINADAITLQNYNLPTMDVVSLDLCGELLSGQEVVVKCLHMIRDCSIFQFTVNLNGRHTKSTLGETLVELMTLIDRPVTLIDYRNYGDTNKMGSITFKL